MKKIGEGPIFSIVPMAFEHFEKLNGFPVPGFQQQIKVNKNLIFFRKVIKFKLRLKKVKPGNLKLINR